MFDNKNSMEEKITEKITENKAKRAATKEVTKMITEMLHASNMPESSKNCLRIINASQELEELIHDTATEATLKSDNLNVENTKKYLVMLIACHNQIKAFLESNPLIMNAEGEKREADEQ